MTDSERNCNIWKIYLICKKKFVKFNIFTSFNFLKNYVTFRDDECLQMKEDY